MSLLVTSCTMGKNPDRLLHKGAAYLRTRTNIGMFAQNRKSAVELLAASKSQFYVKSSVVLDQHQDLAVTHGQNERYSTQNKQKQPLRSKSEFDLSQLQLTSVEDESDENNNDTSLESITQSDNDVLDGTQRLSLEDGTPVSTRLDQSKFPKQSSLEKQGSAESESPKHDAHELGRQSCGDDEFIPTSATVLKCSAQISESHARNGETPWSESEGEIALKKPVPLPRKSKEKPVPPPRRRNIKTPENNKELLSNSRIVQSEPFSLHHSTVLQGLRDTPTRKLILASDKKPTIPKKPETLAHRISSLSSSPSPPANDSSRNADSASKNLTSGEVTEHKYTYTATPIFIGRPETQAENFQARPVFISQSGLCLRHQDKTIGGDNCDSTASKGRKRCPDVPASVKFIKREKKSTASDSSTATFGGRGDEVQEEKSTERPYLKSEMSIESADQAVYHSDINALPSAQMEADLDQVVDGEAREVTRSNSSLSGLIDQQDMSPLSMSPTPYCSTVPRSHSDISCRLESQHSRDSSLVSSHSRLSRASAGADLENFFNQMGLEKGILEPISRLKELQTSEIFDSMSSLDSHDAASICSTYSRSEQEWSETQSLERSHQQTSIIERNARIIKWLCNVRKAKTPTHKAETAAESKD